MIGAKFKFNVVMRVLLLAGSVYAGELPGESKTIPAKEMTAPSDKEFCGFAEAEHFLGQYLYRFDLGTPEEIFNLFKRAYTHGNANAEASLARCYWFGFGTKSDKKKAFEMAKSYLRKTKDPGWSDCFFSIAQTIAGLGYLRFDKNKEKGLKLISATTTVLGVIVVESVYFYGLYGIPQSYGDHDFEGGL